MLDIERISLSKWWASPKKKKPPAGPGDLRILPWLLIVYPYMEDPYREVLL
jgi:hypothetical protein